MDGLDKKKNNTYAEQIQCCGWIVCYCLSSHYQLVVSFLFRLTLCTLPPHVESHISIIILLKVTGNERK